MDELIDIYNASNQWQGTAMKSEAHAKGLWHRSVHCWSVSWRKDQEPRVLFQLRSPEKEFYPNCYDISCAGHIAAGESAWETIQREYQEELGVECRRIDAFESLGFRVDALCYQYLINCEFAEVFLTYDNNDMSSYELGVDELSGLMEMTVRDGLQLFSGKASIAEVETIDVNGNKSTRTVTEEDFIPRIDNYSLKMFIMIERWLNNTGPVTS